MYGKVTIEMGVVTGGVSILIDIIITVILIKGNIDKCLLMSVDDLDCFVLWNVASLEYVRLQSY